MKEPGIDIKPASTITSQQQFDQDTPQVPSVDIKEKWPDFLDSLMKNRPHLGSFMALGYAASSTQTSLDIMFAPNYKFQYMEVTKKNHREDIEKLLHSFFGAPIELRITLENSKSQEGQNYIKQIVDIAPSINDEIEKEPIIQTVLDLFDGEVVG